jgi:hypothetical protein
MLKRALALLGLGTAVAATAAPDPGLYEPMFCDRPELARPTVPDAAAPWQRLLADPAADARAVRALAEDAEADSRVRALAYGWLRARREPVPHGLLLGVVFEIEVAGGLDVLAVYADGRMRYLNHAGGAVLLDALPASLTPAWRAVMDAARAAALTTRPWQRAGSAPPGPGGARLAFVRSDGLHMRQGRFEDLQRDGAAGPLLLAGAQALAQVVQVAR